MKIRFLVAGEPRGKGRPRFSTHAGRVMAFTPPETLAYERLIQAEFKCQCGGKRFGDSTQLDMRVIAYYSIPESAPKWKKAEMSKGIIRPTKTPDWDNIGKVVSDSLNGIAYKDDKQIVDAQIRKFYSNQPRIEVTILAAKMREEHNHV